MKASDLARMPIEESGKLIEEMMAAAPEEKETQVPRGTPETPTTAEFLARMVHFPLEAAYEEGDWVVFRWANGAEMHVSGAAVCVWPDHNLN